MERWSIGLKALQFSTRLIIDKCKLSHYTSFSDVLQDTGEASIHSPNLLIYHSIISVDIYGGLVLIAMP